MNLFNKLCFHKASGLCPTSSRINIRVNFYKVTPRTKRGSTLSCFYKKVL